MNPASRVAAGVLCAVALCAVAQADIWYFEATITDDQHIPPTGSDAFGHATLVYDDVTNLLSCDIYIEGIHHDDLLYGHLHQGRVGFYGEMITMLGHGHMWMHDGHGLRFVGTDIPVDEMWEQDLLTDGAYVNIHSIQWEAGEIRGQAIATPRLSHTALVRGADATLDLSRANPGERVYFISSSAGVGVGPSVPALGGLTLDLLEDVTLLGSAVAGQDGRAQLIGRVPGSAQPLPISLQAVIRRGDDGSLSVKSNTQSTAILP